MSSLALAADVAATCVVAPFVGSALGASGRVDALLLPRRSIRALGTRLATVFGTGVALTGLVSAVHLAGSSFSDQTAFHLSRVVLLACASTAMVAAGTCAAATLRDPLDAGAVVSLASLVAAFACLGAGPAIDLLPRSLLGFALAVSPFTAAASAAGLDIMHDEWIYRLSPLAHEQLPFVDWRLSAAAYVFAAVLCTVATSWRTSRRRDLAPDQA